MSDALKLLERINLDLDRLVTRLLNGKELSDDQERQKSLRAARKLCLEAVADGERAGREDVLVATRTADATNAESESKRKEASVSAAKHRARASALRDTAADKRAEAETLRAIALRK